MSGDVDASIEQAAQAAGGALQRRSTKRADPRRRWKKLKLVDRVAYVERCWRS